MKFISKYISSIDGHMQEVLRGASSALMIRIFGTMLGFSVSVLIARNLGAEGSGIYFLAISVVTIAATVARLGFDNTLVRFIASHASVGEWGEVFFIHRIIVKIVVASSFFIAIGLFFSANFIAEYMFHKVFMTLPLQLVSFAVLPLAISMIQADSLRGLKAIPSSQWIKTVLVSLFTLLLLFPMIDIWGDDGAVVSYVLAVFIGAVLSVLFWRRAWKRKVTGSVPFVKVPVNTLFSSSMPLFAIALTGLVILQAPIIFLGMWGTAEDVGVFNIANRISALLLFPLMAVISILTPKFSEMYRKGEMEELKSLTKKSSMGLMIFALVAAGVIALNAEWVMGLFGEDFKQGSLILTVLLVGVVVNAATGAVAELLMMTGHEKDCRNMNLIGAMIIVLLCMWLIPIYGGMGAAIAVVLGISSSNILMVLLVKRRLDFMPISFIK